MQNSPRNLTILVTGSSRGIGRAIAQRLMQTGYSVVLHGRNADGLQRTANELKQHELFEHQIRSVCFDITDRQLAEQILLNDIEMKNLTAVAKYLQNNLFITFLCY